MSVNSVLSTSSTSDSNHNHAFVNVPEVIRTAEVIRERGSMPEVRAGLRDLRVLKTTQSSFKDFVDDEFRTLPFDDDRLLSTVVTADWSYNTPLSGGVFDKIN